MASPFAEAHQFKGVPINQAMIDAANQPGIDANTAAQLRAQAKPAHTREWSMKFSDGKFFDVQEDDSGQYLVLDREVGAQRVRCYVGSWIVKMPSGKYAVFSNEDYLAMGGAPEGK
jgi:hypothetical protein